MHNSERSFFIHHLCDTFLSTRAVPVETGTLSARWRLPSWSSCMDYSSRKMVKTRPPSLPHSTQAFPQWAAATPCLAVPPPRPCNTPSHPLPRPLCSPSTRPTSLLTTPCTVSALSAAWAVQEAPTISQRWPAPPPPHSEAFLPMTEGWERDLLAWAGAATCPNRRG